MAILGVDARDTMYLFCSFLLTDSAQVWKQVSDAVVLILGTYGIALSNLNYSRCQACGAPDSSEYIGSSCLNLYQYVYMGIYCLSLKSKWIGNFDLDLGLSLEALYPAVCAAAAGYPAYYWLRLRGMVLSAGGQRLQKW